MNNALHQLGFLGPAGSHSHQASLGLLAQLGQQENTELKAYPTLADLMRAVEAGEVPLAALPYENALQGSVAEVLETLGMHRRQLYVKAEWFYTVHHCLVQQPRCDAQDMPVHTVISHPQALGQCRDTLTRLFGTTLKTVASESTSGAVEQLAAMDDAAGYAAIGTKTAAKLHNLEVRLPELSDGAGNFTRFVLVTGAQGLPEGWQSLLEQASPFEKTSLCFGVPERPGALLAFLRPFEAAGINLSKLESRPTRRQYGDYYFFVDTEINLPALQAGNFLQELRACADFLYYQGPYRCLGLTDSPKPLAFYEGSFLLKKAVS